MPHGLSDAQVAALERATLAAVPPSAQAEEAGWLMGFDRGTVGRSHSAAPLSHQPADPALLERIAARYAAEGLPPVLRLPALPAFDALAAVLHARGWRAGRATCVQTATIADVAAHAEPPAGLRIADAPDAAWQAAFLAASPDAHDAASRLAVLQRARGTRFGAVVEAGEWVALGVACHAGGLCGLHGLRTAPAWRGRGLAGRLVAALAAEAARAGCASAFLQVEAANAPAQAAWGRAGFRTRWQYAYWAR